MNEPNLVTLAAALSDAKAREKNAKNARVAAEEAIIKATGFHLSEGQKTYELDCSAGTCSVLVKQPITTSVDSKGWASLRLKLSKGHAARGIFAMSFKLKTKEARELQETDAASWRDIARVITRKPGKVSVEVKSVSVIREAE